MPVGSDLETYQFLAALAAPALGKPDEERLIVSRLSVQRQVICVVRGGESGEIRDVLAQHLVTVEREIREWTICIVLRRERLAGCLEVLEILWRPPVRQPSLRVELAALIVEAVADLVADGRAHGPEVCRGVAVG